MKSLLTLFFFISTSSSAAESFYLICEGKTESAINGNSYIRDEIISAEVGDDYIIFDGLEFKNITDNGYWTGYEKKQSEIRFFTKGEVLNLNGTIDRLTGEVFWSSWNETGREVNTRDFKGFCRKTDKKF